ncbi:hypothetical protein BABINDRAFT_163464 [Babjeviella inositovora NRRL Y-12698]|uniref:candidapepsin n=1 Tax=Babjeviella inositovora NRRL Y-12698 TaxID=984486 RepID=A0A1E3QK38_9ASCO|nr:uncharacterized protein BABINDRAFT_163464 [Babjeviella inositovora NRRL Y-12698]ODQ77442.1 hypothetical protein BABINDRAFT_163464 [Babjeviella inositovora NRRL Y-12698]
MLLSKTLFTILAVLMQSEFILAEATSLTDGVIRVDFDVHKGQTAKNIVSADGTPRIAPRAVGAADEVNLVNESVLYLANVTIGSNKQKLGVLLDTGSSDFWVQGSTNPYCKAGTTEEVRASPSKIRALAANHRAFHFGFPSSLTSTSTTSIPASSQFDCSIYGSFDQSSSSTFHDNKTALSITYGDGTFAKGDFGQDTVSLGGLDVKGVNFAVANNADNSMGVLGIGIAGNEATTVATTPFQYDNFPVQLKKKGLIKKTLYSLYLNSATSNLGSVLFGGVDHAKHYGNLVPLPLVNVYPKNYPEAVSFFVTLAGVGYNKKAVSSGLISALLDSGTTLTYLPKATISKIASGLGYKHAFLSLTYYGPCTGLPSSVLSFLFAGVTINAPISNFLEQAYYSDGSAANNICILGLQASSTYILGDSFLRSAYAVYDLEALQVYLAQAIPNATAEDIVAVTSTIPPGTLVQQTATTF